MCRPCATYCAAVRLTFDLLTYWPTDLKSLNFDLVTWKLAHRLLLTWGTFAHILALCTFSFSS